MDRNSGSSDEGLTESVEELRLRLDAMKRLMDDEEDDDGGRSRRRRNAKNKNSLINASFLSFVFIAVLFIIIGVSFQAFRNLYYAVLKKFHAREHTEL